MFAVTPLFASVKAIDVVPDPVASPVIVMVWLPLINVGVKYSNAVAPALTLSI